MTILFFVFLEYYLQYWPENVKYKVFCSFRDHFGRHMQYYSIKFKMNDLVYLNLHLTVYLCYKMIYVSAIIKRKPVLAHTLICYFFLSLPHPLLRFLNLKSTLEKLYKHVNHLFLSLKRSQSNLNQAALADTSGKNVTHKWNFS